MLGCALLARSEELQYDHHATATHKLNKLSIPMPKVFVKAQPRYSL